MFNLIMKDILVQKKSIFFILFYLFIGLFAFKNMPSTSMTYVIAVTISFLFIIGSFAYDEQNQTHIVINSLPIKRKDLIISKYISVLIYSLISVCILNIFTYIIFVLKLPFKIEILNLSYILNVLIGSMFLASLMLPIYCKFGYTKAKIFTTVSYLFVFIVFNVLGNLSNSIPLLLQEVKLTNVILFSIALLTFILSMFLSISFYENREF